MTKNQTVGIDFENNSDDYYIVEANCELAMVEGQLCSIPYELYDLPDLTGILSIETWNSFLTEEERFFLSCFLPDMDQEAFCLTMQELLGDANLYFGNIVDKFYKILRGGLFTPKIACYKEGVTLFKRKRYYYSIKFYHEKMIKTFTDMQRLWDQYGKELGNKARLLIWSERTQSGNLKVLDLDRIPSEEFDGGATYSEVKSVERNRTNSLNFPCSGGSKNSLKITITKKGAFQYPGSRLLVSSEHCHRTLPKGFLKLSHKSSSAVLGEPYASPENNLREILETGSKSSRFAASPYSGTIFMKPYGTIACSVTELPKCLLNHQDTSFTNLETTQSSIEGTKPMLHDLTHTNPRDVGAPKCSITEHNLPTKQEEYVHYHLKSPSFKPGRGSEPKERKRILSSKNFQREANALRKPLRVLSEDNHHAGETGDDHLFSLTHKRRKVQ